VELRYYYDILRKRMWVILLVMVIAVAGVTLQLAAKPEVYSASTTVMVTPRVATPTTSAAFEDPGLYAFQSNYRQTVLSNVTMMIQSRAVMDRVYRRLSNIPPEQLGGISVTPIRGTDFLAITATSSDPFAAAQMANATSEEFTNYFAEVSAAGAKMERTFIESQLADSKKRLVAAEQALLQFKQQTGIVSPQEHVNWTVGRMLDLQAAQEAARLDGQIAQTRAGFIRSKINSQREMRRSSYSISTDPTFARLRDNLTAQELELASMRQVYTDQHPKVKAVLGRIADTRAKMTQVAERAMSGETIGVNPIRENLIGAMIDSEVNAAAAQARAAGTATIVKQMEARVNAFPKDQATFARLDRDVRLGEQLFMRLSSLQQEAVIRENRAASSGQAAVLVIDPALAPVRPAPKQVPLRAGMAGTLGLVLGSALALLMESLDNRVRTSREAEATYGLPVLGAIPTMDARTLRQLTTAPATSVLMLSLLVAFLIAGALVAVYAVQAGASTDDAIRLGHSIVQTLQGSR
jgi:succinoglycan biosynthesis transport protein ExoP